MEYELPSLVLQGAPYCHRSKQCCELERGPRRVRKFRMTEVTDNAASESPPATNAPFRPHTSHWGVFSARWQGGNSRFVPHPDDPDPNRIIENFPGALRHRARIAQPMVRRGWLEHGPGPTIAADATSSCRWRGTRRSTCSAPNSRRVRDRHGPGAVFGGSYGWSSAGPLPPCAKPGPPLPERRDGRLCAARSTPIVPAPPRCCCRISSATTSS